MRRTVFSFFMTPMFAPQLPYSQRFRLASLVTVLLVSSDPSLCIQVRWSTGWYVPCPHPSTASNSVTSESAYGFHLSRYISPVIGVWNLLTYEHQGYTLIPLRTTNECDSFGLHLLLCLSMRSSRRIYSLSSMASASFVWLHNMHLPTCRTSSLTSLEVRTAMKVSDCSV